ncbi:PepSY domain-containing protein [Pseudothauera nasutitermitis]|uniref:PepSY domain-containing protein n=1 Tax=Pseudothauera nasutitermitis TaxID=2565930 RepID=UPI001E40F7E9|nr:PepSY-associated TM helix domain-containing protein [Pseudothauera nasutitermitis]
MTPEQTPVSSSCRRFHFRCDQPDRQSHEAAVCVFSGERLPVVAVRGLGGADVAWYRTLVSLHEAWYANYPLRWLHFVSGLLGCVMIATGMVLWVIKRRARHAKDSIPEHFGMRLMACLNVAVLAGLPVAVAAYFWANRLLPVSMAERAAWELHAMFLVWGWLFCYAAFRPEKRAWVETLWLATAAFGLVPVVNALTTDRHLGVTIAAGDWPLAGFDLAMFGLAAIFGTIAWKLGRRWAKADTTPVATNMVVAGGQ